MSDRSAGVRPRRVRALFHRRPLCCATLGIRFQPNASQRARRLADWDSGGVSPHDRHKAAGLHCSGW
jgi:hypothetical protein